jgi:hypothetical protein
VRVRNPQRRSRNDALQAVGRIAEADGGVDRNGARHVSDGGCATTAQAMCWWPKKVAVAALRISLARRGRAFYA